MEPATRLYWRGRSWVPRGLIDLNTTLNLNIASWLGNCEMDAVVEDETFARQMEEMYLQDLENATEGLYPIQVTEKPQVPGAYTCPSVPPDWQRLCLAI
jgi:phosphatidylserine/phosphatidylglycerophosphate/cardiolipin synthase-like enzyme